jgi:hypothetical protein
MPLDLAELNDLIDEKILTGGRRTSASNLREVLHEIVEFADSLSGGGGGNSFVDGGNAFGAASYLGLTDGFALSLGYNEEESIEISDDGISITDHNGNGTYFNDLVGGGIFFNSYGAGGIYLNDYDAGGIYFSSTGGEIAFSSTNVSIGATLLEITGAIEVHGSLTMKDANIIYTEEVDVPVAGDYLYLGISADGMNIGNGGTTIFIHAATTNIDNDCYVENLHVSTSINFSGSFSAASYVANGTAGNGYLRLVSQSSAPAAVNGSISMYADASSRLCFVKRNLANSADIIRTFIFPDSSVSYTFPTATDTLASLNTAQTFNANQTIASGFNLTVASDTDATTILGRLKFGSPTTDEATFSHFDHFNTTDYAVKQLSTGQVRVNTKSGTTMVLGVNNANKLSISSTQVNIATGATFQQDDTTDSTSAVTGSINTKGGIGVTKNVFVGGELTVASDTDATTILGRARFYSATSDTMMLSHFDINSSSGFALSQNTAGTTQLNGASVLLKINNSTIITVGANVTIAALTTVSGSFHSSGGARVTGNFAIGGSTPGSPTTSTIHVYTGTAPTASIADGFQNYSADIVAGNAVPHFRTENGDIVKVYSIGSWGTPSGTLTRTTFDTTTVTLPELAERLAALISDLKTGHGLLKA